MKIVKNTSMQGFSVTFETPNGVRSLFVGSKATVKVPTSWGGRVLDNLIRRRQFKVTVVADTLTPVKPPSPLRVSGGALKDPRQKASKKTKSKQE